MLTRDIIPVPLIDTLALITIVVIVVGLIYQFIMWRRVTPPNLWRDIRMHLGWGQIVLIFFKELINRVIIQRELFNERWRWFAHITIFWGFIGLAVTTTISYIQNPEADYVPLTTPYRILGNVSGALLLLGSTIAVLRLLLIPRFRRERTFSDVWFLALLWLTTLTGFTTQYFREVAYSTPTEVSTTLLTFNYILHIVFVGLLIITAPFSAFLHSLTTPTLRYYQRIHANLLEKAQIRDYRELAQITQIEKLYTKSKTRPQR
jgi:nitrate reductase gamma subunit